MLCCACKDLSILHLHFKQHRVRERSRNRTKRVSFPDFALYAGGLVHVGASEPCRGVVGFFPPGKMRGSFFLHSPFAGGGVKPPPHLKRQKGVLPYGETETDPEIPEEGSCMGCRGSESEAASILPIPYYLYGIRRRKRRGQDARSSHKGGRRSDCQSRDQDIDNASDVSRIGREPYPANR